MSSMLVLLVLFISVTPSSALAGYTRYWTQFYETIPGGDTVAFRPAKTDAVPNKGVGFVKHNNVVHTSEGYQVATVGGMYFFHSESVIEDVVTITFSENLGGIWCGSSINLRGKWGMTANAKADLDYQELSISNGQGGFRGATGSVYYQRVASTPRTVFLVTCDIYLPNNWNSIPKTHVNLATEFKSLSAAVKVAPEFQNSTATATASEVLKQFVESS